jgi:signal transduction histidine kinase/ActR/RegA family two-component response regulator
MTQTKTTGKSREERLTSRETAVSGRERAERAREDAVTVREAADRAREDAAALREEAVRAREEAAQVRSELDALMHQVREANEHLIVANLRSQVLAEDAETANRLKDEFIALVSHELRTPLNAVLGWARMLAGKQLTEQRAIHAIKTIERNAAALALIIDDLLDMSRIVAGTLKLTVEPVELISLTRAALDVVRPMAEARNIALTFSADAAAADVVNGDPGRLQQVIGNLLANAIKFTPEGGRVDVSVTQVGSQMEVRIVDTGRGMSADFLPHVFERFRQADNSPSRQQGGLGLGLAIVRQLMELHGGTVHAASEGEGHGSTFLIRLPVLTADASAERWSALADRRFATTTESATARALRLDRIHVLVVDDQADGRALTSLVLTKAGARVKAVSSAHEALQWLESQRPDVLVTELALPEEDGYALVRQIRERERAHGGCLTVIALTGFADAEDKSRLLAAGFQAQVSKPLDPPELIAAIATASRGPSKTAQ